MVNPKFHEDRQAPRRSPPPDPPTKILSLLQNPIYLSKVFKINNLQPFSNLKLHLKQLNLSPFQSKTK